MLLEVLAQICCACGGAFLIKFIFHASRVNLIAGVKVLGWSVELRVIGRTLDRKRLEEMNKIKNLLIPN